MGLIKKKDKEETPELPKLPSLPELPSLPSLESEDHSPDKKELHELPSFPSNNFGEKFSQNNIKSAVSGHEEENDGLENMPSFPKEKSMISPPQAPKTREITHEREFNSPITHRRVVAQEPIFVQIDKFEDSLHVFKKIKRNMEEIEVLLQETKNLKQKEDEELSLWEAEIQEMKNEVERVDKDIFDKV